LLPGRCRREARPGTSLESMRFHLEVRS